MGLFSASKPDPASGEEWIPYRENGEVKYMRADEASGSGPTGGATTHTKSSGWANAPGGGFVANAPQLLPERYTDDSILPYVITDVLPSTAKEGLEEPKKKGGLRRFLDNKGSKDDPTVQVVYMPRREYKKYFAKDKDSKYVGTEPQRSWTAEELEEEFGQYQK